MQNPFRDRSQDDFGYGRRNEDDRDTYGARAQEQRSWRDGDDHRGYRAQSGGRQDHGQYRDYRNDDYGAVSPYRGGREPQGVGRYGRDQQSADYGRGYADYGRSDYGAADQGRWDQQRQAQEYRSHSHAPGAQIWDDPGRSNPDRADQYQSGSRSTRQNHEFEPDYLHWRDQQMSNLDHDYSAWRDERRQKFSSDFDTWRQSKPRDEHGRIRTQAENSVVGEISEGRDGPREKSPLANRDRKS